MVKDLINGGNKSNWQFKKMLEYMETAKRKSGNYRYTPDITDGLHKDIRLLYVVDMNDRMVKVFTVASCSKPTVEYVTEHPYKINVFTAGMFEDK